jgi:hypothetical protein
MRKKKKKKMKRKKKKKKKKKKKTKKKKKKNALRSRLEDETEWNLLPAKNAPCSLNSIL